MSKLRAALATAALAAALGAGLPTTAATAAPAMSRCADVYNNFRGDGQIRAYEYADCQYLLGGPTGNDSNWADGTGEFTGDDNDAARSLVNTGTYSGGLNVVKFYENANYTGGHGCLDWEELYVASLLDNTFNNGVPAYDRISSHQWVYQSACGTLWT